VATEALLRSRLVQNALAAIAPQILTPPEISHVRQTTIARAYHERVDVKDAEEIWQAYANELKRGPSYKRIHRNSIYGLPDGRIITRQEYVAWLVAIQGAPRRPRAVKASAGAPPSITQATMRVAEFLGALFLREPVVVIDYYKLARKRRIGRRTAFRAIEALVQHGFLKLRRRRQKLPGRFQLEDRQARNAYTINLTRSTPKTAVS